MLTKLKLRSQLAWARARANHYPSSYSSHSQFGEDMILRSYFRDQKRGFYVDIGAHHPLYYSNTYHFYSRGWRGLNIDAAPGSLDLFKAARPRDMNVEACLGTSDGATLPFHVFDRPALNTLDSKRAREIEKAGQGRVIQTIQLSTRTLTTLLNAYLEPGQVIDFLNIDIEGLDEEILKSNDWLRHRPRAVVFERHQLSPDEPGRDALVQFMKGQGYSIIGVSGPSVVMGI